ncbi:hypothetical protein T484DRAFT_1793200 [Baffinella frigidus]|nr:hypothetical protein T484DRAFT_1793200 [Cryptophyta sp. CCMP2293]
MGPLANADRDLRARLTRLAFLAGEGQSPEAVAELRANAAKAAGAAGAPAVETRWDALLKTTAVPDPAPVAERLEVEVKVPDVDFYDPMHDVDRRWSNLLKVGVASSPAKAVKPDVVYVVPKTPVENRNSFQGDILERLPQSLPPDSGAKLASTPPLGSEGRNGAILERLPQSLPPDSGAKLASTPPLGSEGRAGAILERLPQSLPPDSGAKLASTPPLGSEGREVKPELIADETPISGPPLTSPSSLLAPSCVSA